MTSTSSYSTRIDIEARHQEHLRAMWKIERRRGIRQLEMGLALFVVVTAVLAAVALFSGPLMWLASR